MGRLFRGNAFVSWGGPARVDAREVGVDCGGSVTPADGGGNRLFSV